ncbi:hypothetical protein CC86DRAFT_357069 [Ophiobolus disseminans]|uniref:Rhodopsin domain-containing protein n=1 Tax=Ophiobolus disseminans TaxID=1469910 RepID=A0A6A6ZPZ0_9PLEO|nr:hypothetical protein CC86DRAFT_357069 [Ophiobolus disseminans]
MSGQFVDFGGVRVDISQFDFADSSSRVATVRTTSITLIILVALVVSLRLFARAKFVGRIFVDDATHKGLGTHIWQFPLDTIFQSVKSCILLAIISSYLRFIDASTFRLVMYVTLFVTASIWICTVFVSVFQCRPISGAWDYTVQESCIDYIAYLYASSAINVLTDIVLYALPIPHLWRLSGAGACVAGVARIAYLHTLRVPDVPFQSVPSLNLSVIECSLGIICVSIPALRPLVARLFPRSPRTNRTSSTNIKSARSQNIPLDSVSADAKASISQSDHGSDMLPFAHSPSIGRAL